MLPLSNDCFRVLQDEEQTKDIIQEVFISLFLKRKELPADLNVPGYLRNAVKYKVSNLFRDRLSRSSHHQELIRREQYSELRQPHPYETDERNDQIASSINILPVKCRQAFMLSYYDNLSYKAIAMEMGISVKTVEKHISKALHILRTKTRPV